MPLSPPVDREPLHRRTVECRGYRRRDGLWDIEGHLVDTKDYSFDSRERGEVKAGEPVHEMWLRLTVDDDLVVHQAEAATDYSPYRICPDITSNFAQLKGLKIGPGGRRAVQERVGGVHGCTHLVELLGPLATAAVQTQVVLHRERETKRPADKRPWIIDTCHAYRSDGDKVRQNWPKFYTGPAQE